MRAVAPRTGRRTAAGLYPMTAGSGGMSAIDSRRGGSTAASGEGVQSAHVSTGGPLRATRYRSGTWPRARPRRRERGGRYRLSWRAVGLAIAVACADPAVDAAAQGGVDGDRAALVALYDATGGPDWTDGANWTSAEPIDAWHGVATGTDGRVTEIALPENNLAGTLPAALGNLTRLRRLDLGGNRFGGTIPAELGNLADLEELSLWNEDDLLDPDDDGLTGTIPAALGNLGQPDAARPLGPRP